MKLLNCYIQYVSKFGNSAVATGVEKVSFHSNPKKGNAKEYSNYHTVVFISHGSEVMLSSKASTVCEPTKNFQMFKLGLEKSRGTRDLIANIHWITEKGREFQKISTSASLTMLKTLTVWITTGKFLKRWEYQTSLPIS